MSETAGRGSYVWLLLAALLIWGTSVAAATDPAPTGSGAQGKPAPPGKPTPSGTAKPPAIAPPSGQPAPAPETPQGLSATTAVCGVKSGPGQAALYDNEPIKVEVKGLQDWLKKHDNDVSTLVLFLDGRAIPNLPVRFLGPRKRDTKDDGCWGKDANAKAVDAETDVLIFDLQRDKDSNPVWRILLARPDDWNFQRTFKVGVGPSSKILPDTTGGATLTLAVVSTGWAQVFLGIVIASFGLLLLAGYFTNMLRDTTTPMPAGAHRPFSLGRVQMAFWFFLVAAAYVLIYLVTGDHHNLTSSALWLVGISSATALGSIAIDVIKQNPPGAAPPPVAPPPVAPPPAPPAVLAGHAAGHFVGQTLINSTTFFQDLLGTDDGDSLHRLQMLIWTVVLGAIFVYSVLQNLVMPEFSTEALALMGVSGGTYVGFKLKEKS